MAKSTGIDTSLRGGLRAARKNYRGSLGENKGDYDVTVSANTAGAQGLIQQLGVYQAGLAGSGRRAVTSLTKLVAQSKAQQRAEKAAVASTVSRYGTAVGGTVSDAYAGAGARSAANTARAIAAAGQGVAGVQAGNIVSDIAAQGAAAQQAAGEYALAQAFQARNAISAETFATLSADLYKTALSYQMQWDMWKKQTDYTTKQASKADKGAVARLAGEAPAISASIGDIARAARAEGTMSDLNVTETVSDWASQNGYSDPAEIQFATSVLQNIKNGMTIVDAASAAVKTLYGGYPGFEKWGDGLAGAVGAGSAVETYAQTWTDPFGTPAKPDWWPDNPGGPSQASVPGDRYAGARQQFAGTT